MPSSRRLSIIILLFYHNLFFNFVFIVVFLFLFLCIYCITCYPTPVYPPVPQAVGIGLVQCFGGRLVLTVCPPVSQAAVTSP